MLPRKFKARNGRTYLLGRLLGVGGQGEAYEAIEKESGLNMVAKFFFDRYSDSDTRRRTDWLVGQNLSSLSPLFSAPGTWADVHGRVAHVAPKAPGESLDTMLEKVSWGFREGLQLAISIARGVSIVEQMGMAVGDISAPNILVFRDGIVKPSLIDLDNFVYPGLPKPRMAGNRLYMAPEVVTGNPPSIESDRFSLAFVVSEVVLFRHPLHEFGSDEAAYFKALQEGTWKLDPVYVRRRGTMEGYPPEVLSPSLHRLFRRAVSCDPSARPTANEWVVELFEAYNRVSTCPRCDGELVVDASQVCPLCDQEFPVPVLECPAGRVPLVAAAVVVGRQELGGSHHVSRRHAIFRRVGPELFLEDISSTGVFRRNPDGAWSPLSPREELLVKSGDVLRLGDVEVRIGQLM